MIRSFLVILALILVSSLAEADDSSPRVGVIIPLTGPLGSYGSLVRQSIERVKVPGIQWTFEDEGCDPAKTVSAFKKLTEVDGISFILGPCCGSPQKALAPLLMKKERLVVLPNAAPKSVLSLSGGKMFSVQYSVEAEASFLAEQMNRRDLHRVAILAVENEFSQTMESSFLKTFHGNVAYSFHAPSFDAQHMKAAALKLKSIDFDSIFLADISPLLLGFLPELRKLGIAQKPVFTNYGAQLPDVLAAGRDKSDGVMYSYPNVPDTEDALGYFPNLAAQILAIAVSGCNGKYACVVEAIKTNPHIEQARQPAGTIVLKKIENGKYVRLPGWGGI
jgi:branched-chain amino acid transport system substrate-binding protein